MFPPCTTTVAGCARRVERRSLQCIQDVSRQRRLEKGDAEHCKALLQDPGFQLGDLVEFAMPRCKGESTSGASLDQAQLHHNMCRRFKSTFVGVSY